MPSYYDLILKPSLYHKFRMLEAETLPDRNIYLFYVLTGQNEIRKYSFDLSGGSDGQACLVNVWSNLFAPLETVLTMKLIRHEHALIIGTSSRVIRLSAHTCHKHLNESECQSSGDPHCGWNRKTNLCTTELAADSSTEWLRGTQPETCSPEKYLVPWEESPWYSCQDQNTNEQCSCRKRECRSFKKCPEESLHHVQITNCSRNGGWTLFSVWTTCSVTCGSGIRQRQRTCANPEPQFGGLDCDGKAIDAEPCNVSVVCPSPQQYQRSFKPRLQEWGPYGECSRSCGGGIQRRSRSCVSDSSQAKCDSPQTEVRECGLEPCPVIKQHSDWTNWVSNTGKSVAKEEFSEHRFQCIAVVDMARGQNVCEITMNHEERFCPTAESCHTSRIFDASLESTWTPWFQCDDQGLQHRFQNCPGSQQRVCNVLPKDVDEDRPWGCWSDWSLCRNSEQNRYRVCLMNSKSCSKGETERVKRICKRDDAEGEPVVSSSMSTPDGGTLVYLVIGCVLSFFAGVGVVLSIIMFMRRNKQERLEQFEMNGMGKAYPNMTQSRHEVHENAYTPSGTKAPLLGNGSVDHTDELKKTEDANDEPSQLFVDRTDRTLPRTLSVKSQGSRRSPTRQSFKGVKARTENNSNFY